MKMLAVAVLSIALGFPLLTHAAVPDVWVYNDACERALHDADYPQAIFRCEAAADLAARVRPGAPEQATALDHMAQLRADQGDFEQAVAYAQQAREITEALFGAYDPMMVPVLLHQALIEQISGNRAQAEQQLLRAQAILDLYSETDDLEVAETQQRLGTLYLDLHRYTEAQQAFQRALDSLIRYFGAENLPETMLPKLIERARDAGAHPDAVAP